jgi:UTP---glucose-1-phosphate uridylyltransferase
VLFFLFFLFLRPRYCAALRVALSRRDPRRFLSFTQRVFFDLISGGGRESLNNLMPIENRACFFKKTPGKFTIDMLERLDTLAQQLACASSDSERLLLLNPLSSVQRFWNSLSFAFPREQIEYEIVLKQLAAIGEADALFEGDLKDEGIRELVDKLLPIDRFYREIGGIVGYSVKVKELLEEKSEERAATFYHSPQFFHIGEETEAVKEAITWGIEALPELAEIYPLGGAADRLHLVDPKSNTELPAAKLPFAGRTLLEHLILNLQARERLYYERYGKGLITPIAIMTSHEKNNHDHVMEICKSKNWFGRGEESFRFFTQPLVPTVNERGQWCKTGPLKPLLKPGGHGAIWKLAKDSGVFDWLANQGRSKALVRQINNPIAGLDYGLLAFFGIGVKKKKEFGFASCPRLIQAAEGVNVLVERKKETHSEVVLTNIEYCDFAKFGIEDKPLKEGEPYSRFSSNTNILFADLNAISKAVEKCPFPGLLINLKAATYVREGNEKREERIGRLESTMQNIADVFIERKDPSLSLAPERTFVTYNRRHKTISTAKKAYIPGKSPLETPENCFYDLLTANRELLEELCQVKLPSRRSFEEMLQYGPEALFLYHPSLGPLYATIAEKIQGGEMALGAELFLEICDFKAKNLILNGSLQVIAEQPMGHIEEGKLHYSDRIGRCYLENVTVHNEGVDWMQTLSPWKMDLTRKETVKIILKGNSSFTAKNVTLKGNETFVVEAGEEKILEG